MEEDNSRHSLESESFDEDDDFDANEDAEDDEATLDEEEGLDEDGADELDDLEADKDIPLEELRKMYGYGGEAAEPEAPAPDVPTASSSRGYFDDVDEGEQDDDYAPPDPWKKEVRVDPELYQVAIPPLLENMEEPDVGEEEKMHARLLWSPIDAEAGNVDDEKLNSFIMECMAKKAEQAEVANGDIEEDKKIPKGQEIRDDEDALFALKEASYVPEAAIASYTYVRHANAATEKTVVQPKKRWQEAEVDKFEEGLRIYGKNFFRVQQVQLPLRRPGELVEFYYTWKKTERYDTYLAAKKISEKPAEAADYMDDIIHHMDQKNDAPREKRICPDGWWSEAATRV